MLPRIRPMRLRALKEPFDNPEYVFELKHDGFRAVVYLEAGECKIISRNQRSLGFRSLQKALSKLPVQSAIIKLKTHTGNVKTAFLAAKRTLNDGKSPKPPQDGLPVHPEAGCLNTR